MIIIGEHKGSTTPELEELVQSYAEKARQLDKILDGLTKDYCANNCPCPPLGCCDEDHYLQGVDYRLREIFDSLHKEEFKERIPVGRKPQSVCDYHTSQGCVLKTKSPVCLGYMCEKLYDNILFQYLRQDGMEHNAFEFVNSMERFHSIKLSKHDSPRLFYYMDKAIKAGNALLDFKKPMTSQRTCSLP